MKYLTDNDIALLRKMWIHMQLWRSHLATSEQRTADRLAAAGILQYSELDEDLTGRGWGRGGNGYHIVYHFNPEQTILHGDSAIVAQLCEHAPELLAQRPIGEEAQRQLRIVC